MAGTVVRRGTGTALASAPDADLATATYDVLGVRVRVVSDQAYAVELIDRSYGALRALPGDGDVATLHLTTIRDGSYLVRGTDGTPTSVDGLQGAALELLHQLVIALMAGLHEVGRFAVHAASVARDGRCIVLAGPGEAGKTTLALALAARGFEILSDELAILDPSAGTVYPYRRNVHVRPGTPELVDGLERIAERPNERLGGGIAWALTQAELGGSMDTNPRRLAGVVLLAPRDATNRRPVIRPLRPSVAAMTLLRGTWAASVDFAGSLNAIARAVEDVPCVELRSSTPMASAAAVARWLEDIGG